MVERVFSCYHDPPNKREFHAYFPLYTFSKVLSAADCLRVEMENVRVILSLHDARRAWEGIIRQLKDNTRIPHLWGEATFDQDDVLKYGKPSNEMTGCINLMFTPCRAYKRGLKTTFSRFFKKKLHNN